MSPSDLKYLIIGLFVFVVIGSLYLLFNDGFKLEKRDTNTPLFRAKTKQEQRGEFKSEILIGDVFVLFIILLEKCSN
jgi:hypothetical protein